MAATGNEPVSLSQLKEYIGNKLYPVNSLFLCTDDTSPASVYGGVWERLEEGFLYSSPSDSCSTGDTGQYSLNITTIPEGYRPTSDVTGSCQVVIDSWSGTRNASVVVNTNGTVSVSYDNDTFYDVKNISITYHIDNVAEEPEGIYAVTVEQAIRYLNKSN